MGCSVSFFKRLCQWIWIPKKRDRWVRDDRRLLPDVVEPNKRPHYGAIPKRIEQRVIEDIVEQDLPRRLPDDRPECNFFDEIHRKLIGALYQHPEELDSSLSLDSGNKETGGSSKDEKKNEGVKHKMPSWLESSGGPVWRDMVPMTGKADDGGETLTAPVIAPVAEEGMSDDDALAIGRLIAEYRQEMADAGDVTPSVNSDGEAAASYQLERYDIVVHSCSSGDASWMEWCGS